MTLVYANVIQSAFSPLISVFHSVLKFLHDHITSSWGLSIIGLTLIVRAVLVPLTVSQLRSMAKMRRIQPQIKELQDRYKGDRQRQSEEMMKVYKEYGVNPFASCLPLLLQLPVFISLFYMLRTNLKQDICGPQLVKYYDKLHHAAIVKASKLPGSFVSSTSCKTVHHADKFLFINDITTKATGVALVVLILLYVSSQMAASLVMTVTADPTQRRLMLLLPLVFVALIFSFPAGLLLYWITTNLWTLGQSLIVQRMVNRDPAPVLPKGLGGGGATGGGGGSKGGGGGGSKGPKASPNGSGAEAKPELAGVGSAARGAAAPPPPPRKRKKRSGRRR